MAKMIRRTVHLEISQLGDREVTVRWSTNGRARDGHILEPDGCVLDNYRANPIVLWQHSPLDPIGNNEDITVQPGAINARTVFAPAGISPEADKICGLVKTGVIRTGSIGFLILEGDPIEPGRPKAGIRATKWELLECSFVSVPSDTGAMVTGRAAESEDSNMPVERAVLRRQLLLTDTALKLRGMYGVAQLAYLLQDLGYAKDCAEWEKNLEGDDSQVPAMLGDVLIELGNTLVAMTKEEVSELLGDTLGTKAIDDEMGEGDRTYLRDAPSEFARSWRTALVHVRSGKKISAANAAKLDDAAGHLDRAATAASSATSSLNDAAGHQEAIGDSHAAAHAAHGKMADAIEAAGSAAPADAPAALAKVQQHHKAVGKHLAAIGERCVSAGDATADAAGSVAVSQRCVRAALRCMRGVSGSEDTDSQDVQTSSGDIDDSTGDRSDDFDFRKRQAALLNLATR